MIFLDTNILSYYLIDDTKIKVELRNRIRNNELICTTIINVYEILRGFKWKNNPKKETLFRSFLDNLKIFSIDDEAVEIASEIYSNQRKKGENIEDADILIAAIVLANNGILITNNTKHFQQIEGLNIENWV